MTSSTLIKDYLSQGSGAPVTAPPVASGVTALYWDQTNLKAYVYDWNAVAWKAAGGAGGFTPFASTGHPVAPLASAFTLNQGTSLAGTATKADLASGRGVVFTIPDHSTAGHNIAVLFPTTPPTGFATALTFSTMMHINRQALGVGMTGIYIRDSAGKIVTWAFYPGAADERINSLFVRQAYASLNAVTGTITSWNLNTPEVPFWMKLVIASSTVTVYFSYDGENYGQVDSVAFSAISAYFNGTLQDYGVFGDLADNGAGGPFQATMYTNVYEFSQSSP